MAAVTTFLMFDGKAAEAMEFYVSLLPDSRIADLQLYGPGERGAEGSVKGAVFELAGNRLLCIDTPVKHAFTFTPAMSLFIECDDEAQIDRLFGQLAEGGQVLMPLGAYGFSRKFGWLNDRFGVSWQLTLPA